MRHIIAIHLQNEAGALSRVAGLFSTRGYNIESLSVAATNDPTVSRITLVTKGSDSVIQQILNQLQKLIDVVAVEDMTRGEHIERELVLLKLKVEPKFTDSVRGYVVRAGGRVLDPHAEGFVVELTASEAEVSKFVEDLGASCEILDVVRSGALGVARHPRALSLVR
jgi:acetolactate synthase-1/3 small subunit